MQINSPSFIVTKKSLPSHLHNNVLFFNVAMVTRVYFESQAFEQTIYLFLEILQVAIRPVLTHIDLLKLLLQIYLRYHHYDSENDWIKLRSFKDSQDEEENPFLFELEFYASEMDRIEALFNQKQQDKVLAVVKDVKYNFNKLQGTQIIWSYQKAYQDLKSQIINHEALIIIMMNGSPKELIEQQRLSREMKNELENKIKHKDKRQALLFMKDQELKHVKAKEENLKQQVKTLSQELQRIQKELILFTKNKNIELSLIDIYFLIKISIRITCSSFLIIFSRFSQQFTHQQKPLHFIILIQDYKKQLKHKQSKFMRCRIILQINKIMIEVSKLIKGKQFLGQQDSLDKEYSKNYGLLTYLGGNEIKVIICS
ncbi:hypothetical protein pb186bvf_020643 [Paramecium bursaria]